MVNSLPGGQPVKLTSESVERRRLDRPPPPPAYRQSADGTSTRFCLPASLLVSREDASLGLTADPQASHWPPFQTTSIGTTPTCHA